MYFTTQASGASLTLRLQGEWRAADLADIERQLAALPLSGVRQLEIGTASLGALDLSGAWLLRTPVTVGQRWPTRNERQAEVVNTNVRIETPRGTFEGCVQVNEDGGEMEIHVETVYCTDIGAVAMASSMTSDMTGMTVTQRAELREYVVGGLEEDETEE